MSTFVIGVDPGQTTGICALGVVNTQHQAELLQATPGLVVPIVKALLGDYDGFTVPSLIAVERFVVGPRASRSSTPKAGQVTRELIGALDDLGRRFGLSVVQRSASEVKPWATDARLKAAGIQTKGMPHALDAARHALFAATKDCGLPDPLSSRNTRRAQP